MATLPIADAASAAGSPADILPVTATPPRTVTVSRAGSIASRSPVISTGGARRSEADQSSYVAAPPDVEKLAKPARVFPLIAVSVALTTTTPLTSTDTVDPSAITPRRSPEECVPLTLVTLADDPPTTLYSRQFSQWMCQWA